MFGKGAHVGESAITGSEPSQMRLSAEDLIDCRSRSRSSPERRRAPMNQDTGD